jgi:hypothetical protein
MNAWSRKEDNVLRAYWQKGGMAAVVDQLPGRTRDSIRGRVKKLELRVSAEDVIRRPRRSKGYDCRSREIAFWMASWLLAERPRVPGVRRIISRWNVTRATAYRWRRWGLDKLEQIRARERVSREEREHVSHLH